MSRLSINNRAAIDFFFVRGGSAGPGLTFAISPPAGSVFELCKNVTPKTWRTPTGTAPRFCARAHAPSRPRRQSFRWKADVWAGSLYNHFWSWTRDRGNLKKKKKTGLWTGVQKLLDTASGPVTYENEKAPKSQMGKPFIFLSFFFAELRGKNQEFFSKSRYKSCVPRKSAAIYTCKIGKKSYFLHFWGKRG